MKVFCRNGILILVVLASAVMADDSSEKKKLDSRNREQLTLAMTKHFAVVMRRRKTTQVANESLAKFIDPKYLEKHNLKPERFKIGMFPVYGIHNITIADDKSTVLCEVNTAEKDKFVYLQRVVEREGKLYFSPALPPDDDGVVTPWILKSKLQ